MILQDLLAILTALFGSTSMFSLYLLWRTRKSEIKKAEATTLDAIDSIYTKMTIATDKKIEEMQNIIDNYSLKQIEFEKLSKISIENGIKVNQLQKTIANQEKEIQKLRGLIKQYSETCSNCKINEIKVKA